MVQKLYLHDAATTDTGTLPGLATQSTALVASVTATGASTNRSMNGTVGTAQVAASLATLANTSIQNNWFRRFLSPPIAAQTTPGGQWTFEMAGFVSNTNSPLQPALCLYLWRPSTGTRIGYIFTDGVQVGSGLSTSTSEIGMGTVGIGASPFTALDGDIIVLEVWGHTAGQGMSTSYTWTFDYDGTVDPQDTVAISSAASYLSASADIPLFTPSTFIAAKNKPILQAVNRAANWCKHQRRDSGLYVPQRRVLLPTSS